jgi:dihydroneopterin aldolase
MHPGQETSMNDPSFARPLRAVEAAVRQTRSVFIRGLELDAAIGVWAEERGRRQRVRIDVEMSVQDPGPLADDHSKVVCYDDLATRIEALLEEGHINLVETLADRVAELCLDDPRVVSARVRVEKPGALSKAETVGVEVVRGRP